MAKYMRFVETSGIRSSNNAFVIVDESGDEIGRIEYSPLHREYIAEFRNPICGSNFWTSGRLNEVSEYVKQLQDKMHAA